MKRPLETKTEFQKEVERTQGSRIISDLSKSSADRRMRERLIDVTIDTWYKVAPKRARWFAQQLTELAKVENPGGKYRNKQGYVQMRLPRELFVHLRRVFERCAPEMETFGTEDADIHYIRARFPQLMPAPKGKTLKARTD